MGECSRCGYRFTSVSEALRHDRCNPEWIHQTYGRLNMAERKSKRGPGRPPLPLVAVRSHNISVRVNDEAFAAFTAAARASGKTRAAWIRERLFSAPMAETGDR